MTNPYEDIIRLPHHVSKKHPPMPMSDRAAQFAPFAALSGYGDAVREEARLTEADRELDEEMLAALDEKLKILQSDAGKGCRAYFTYFKTDERKAGGSYVTVRGVLKKTDALKQMIYLEDGTRLSAASITDITFESPSTI